MGYVCTFLFCLSWAEKMFLSEYNPGESMTLQNQSKGVSENNDCLIRPCFMGLGRFFSEMEDTKRTISQRKPLVKYLELWIIITLVFSLIVALPVQSLSKWGMVNFFARSIWTSNKEY